MSPFFGLFGKDAPGTRREVLDMSGNRHRLTEELGQGGQGAVYRTANREIAVKLLLDDRGEPLRSDGSSREAELRRSIERVMTLPLPARGIASPLAPLRDAVGYTMRLLDGMVPLGRLLAVSGSPADHYRTTGGLRRRLALLARLADRMASLHASGLVFTDLSPNNVFMSSGVEASEIWLIDPDNIHYLEQSRLRFHTPRYGAPEIVSGRSGANTLSDCWSFAVIAHEVLRMVHPFEGVAVPASSWDVTASGVQKPGEPPLTWIDDPEDDRNRTANGLPLLSVATRRLAELFTRCLTGGRESPAARPSMQEWSDALWEAHDVSVTCTVCKGSALVSGRPTMDCCGAPRPSLVLVSSRLWIPELDEGLLDLTQSRTALAEAHRMVAAADPEGSNPETARATGALGQRPPLATLRACASGTVTVPVSFTEPAVGERRREASVELRFSGNRLVVEALESRAGWSWIDGSGAGLKPFLRKIEVPVGAGRQYLCHLHCGSDREAHRLLSIVHYPGESGAR
jgi:serine/threonine protein kinase